MSGAAAWKEAIDSVLPAIVVIRTSSPQPFDGNESACSEATGFVVDKERGLILTNRHVVQTGPISADAVFVNKEEVDLEVVYRDPVHDFGFCRFRPQDLKYLSLAEIKLHPEGAFVGQEIRIVGNDDGEKISILPGTLARLDRQAPTYDDGIYSDWNTFYYIAASGTSGGSSGSPVLNIKGEAIALNCGGSDGAASSFYLPLHRVKRALELIQKGQALPPRGTIQTVFVHEAFDEVRRLGLTSEVERKVRQLWPSETGMLVVRQVIPQGPADGALEPGDVLLEVDNKWCVSFLELETALDDFMGKDISFKVQRGGKDVLITVKVQDLHTLIPTEYLSISQGVVHPVSYQVARKYHLPAQGVLVASRGYMYRSCNLSDFCIVTKIGSTPTRNLDEYQAALEALPHGSRTAVYYYEPDDQATLCREIFTIDRKWFPCGRYRRVGPSWVYTPAKDAPTPAPSSGRAPKRSRRTVTTTNGTNGVLHKQPKVEDCLVFVTFDTPFKIDGLPSRQYRGVGLVIDIKQGLVLTDRQTAPIGLADVLINIGGIRKVPGEVVFIHPLLNLSIIKYNPESLVGSDVVLCEASIGDAHPAPGDSLILHGLSDSFEPIRQQCTVTATKLVYFPDAKPPQYVSSTIEMMQIGQMNTRFGGVFEFEKDQGKVIGLVQSFSYRLEPEGDPKECWGAVSMQLVAPVVALLKGSTSIPPQIPAVPIKLMTVSLAEAYEGLGLPHSWYTTIKQKARAKPGRHEALLLSVKRVCAGTSASKGFASGDVLLSMNGKPLLRPSEIQVSNQDPLTFEVLRNQEVIKVVVEPTMLDTLGTSRVLVWAGALLQEPYLAVRFHGEAPEGGGVYVSTTFHGSPTEKCRLPRHAWITAANDVPTPDLESFLQAVTKVSPPPSSSSSCSQPTLRLRVVKDGKVLVVTVRPDYVHCPTFDYAYNRVEHRWDATWHMQSVPRKP